MFGRGMRLDELRAGHFEDRVGEAFRICVPELGEPLDGELVEVDTPQVAVPDDWRAPFSLVFRGPPEPVLPQGLYAIDHDELGVLELFIVPIARKDDGVRYQAVFS
jgi:uncharacterized protein DUF6916